MSFASQAREATKAAAALKRSNEKGIVKIVPPPNITEIQRNKEFQKLICFMVVCNAYGSGAICRVEGKHEMVHDALNKMLPRFINKTNEFEDFSEYVAGEFTMEQMRINAKGKPMTGEKIWVKGMEVRREATDQCSGELGHVLKFKTIKPPSDIESDCMVEEADFGLVEEFESGGTEDLALAGLLLKVRICKDRRPFYYYYHYYY